jgi:hypothetical protein
MIPLKLMSTRSIPTLNAEQASSRAGFALVEKAKKSKIAAVDSITGSV